MTIETKPPEKNPEKSAVWERIQDYWTPYRVANTVFFVLFLGADVSLFIFGRQATGNVLLALILTLLSGVGALLWKRQRDNPLSNEFQRSVALWMIILHAAAAVIFLGGNFSKGGWDALAGSVKIDGTLANDLLDYYVLLEKVFMWSIVVMLAADLVALFVFMENDTEKKHDRELAAIARDDRDARIAAQKRENQQAHAAYKEHSEKLADIRGLVFSRERLIQENAGKVDANTLNLALADIDNRIAVLAGGIPVDIPAANSSPDGEQKAEAVPGSFTKPPTPKG